GFRAHGLIDATLLDVFGDPDYREPGIRPTRAQSLPDWVPPVPVRVGQRLVDDGNPTFRCDISGLKTPALQDRDARRFEKSGHHPLVVDRDRRPRHRRIGDLRLVGEKLAIEWQAGYRRGPLDARHGAQLLKEPLICADPTQ